jgi:hypothetical protein
LRAASKAPPTDRYTAGGGQQSAASRQIQAARAVAARADDVDVRPRRNRRPERELAHTEREAANLVCRFALEAQGHEQAAGQRRREFPARHEPQQRRGARLVEILPRQQAVEQLRGLHAHG